MKRLALLIPLALAAATGADALGPAGAMPDISKQYYQRVDCHEAYDLLAETIGAKGAVSDDERAWAVRYEDAGDAGKPCPAPPDALAQRAAGRVLSTQDGLARAAQYIKAGDPAAYFDAGWAVLQGKAPNVDKADGVAMIRKSAELGDPAGEYMLAMFHIGGAFGAADYAAGFPLIEAAAKAGHVDALFQAGNMLKEGLGTKKDSARAFSYYTQAAERGHLYAAIMAFYMIQDGEGTKKDFDLAYRLARHIADAGEPIGAVLAASALLQQKDVMRHEDEILYWIDVADRDGDDSIRAQVSPFRPKVVAAFQRAKAPPEYQPPVRKECPMKTVCLVDRYSGIQNCTTNKDYWHDCDF